MDRVLIVDDEKGMRDFLSIMLKKEGYAVVASESADKASELVGKGEFDLVISDIAMPGKSGIEILKQTKAANPDTPVIMITAYASTESAIEALKLGAYDYIIKPFDVEEMKTVVRNAIEKRRLENENRALKRELKEKLRFDEMIGDSPRMREVLDLIAKIAPTGAVTAKKGLFEVADGGTIFLDEIGDTTPAMQIKLLRVLQERRIRRVGGTDEIEVNVRVLAATNHDLEQLVRQKRFREDLYYRINVIQIRMPALREKPEDIPKLALHFLVKYGRIMGKKITRISEEAMRRLTDHDWPGNVRELENVIERAVALEATDAITADSLSREVRSGGRPAPEFAIVLSDGGIDLERQLERLREHYMEEALRRAQGIQTRAAEILGMSFRSFRYFAKKYRLTDRKEARANVG